MPKTNRTPADQQADRSTAAGLVDQLRAARADLRAAIRALPAAGSRTAAQRRDVLIMRTLALLIQATLTSWGVAQTADRDQTET